MKNTMHQSMVAIGCSVAVVLLFAINSFPFTMTLMNLEEMAVKAERIVAGVCIDRQEGEIKVGAKGHNLPFTQYTFNINEVIKGKVGKTLTIRQVQFGEGPHSYNSIPMPDYEPGQEVLLFLGPDSEWGLTSPVAMGQAVFDIETRRGKRFIKNRFGNQFLFRGLSAEQLTTSKGLSKSEVVLISQQESKRKEKTAQEQMPYDSVVSLIRKLSQER